MYACMYVCMYVCVYYIYIYKAPTHPQPSLVPPVCALRAFTCTHGSCLIRRQSGHPGVVLPLVVSNSANH